jgi:cysteine desulfurase
MGEFPIASALRNFSRAGTPIYLDHHATTPVDPRVAEVVLHAMTVAFGNANSTEHAFGEIAGEMVHAARVQVGRLMGAVEDAVHFTSGSTESIRLALDHAISSKRAGAGRPLRVAASTVEHHAVMDRLSELRDAGLISIQWVPVDHEANLDLDALEAALRQGADLVCVMAANNEVGTIYPVQEIAERARQHGADILVDATQAVGHIPIHVEDWGLTYLALSAHKIYGPKGIGALVTQDGMAVRRDAGARGAGIGTPNVPGIAGLGEACRLIGLHGREDALRLRALRDRLEATLLSGIDGLVINGARQRRLAHNLHVAIPGLPGDAVIARLSRSVAVSSGAACSSGVDESSHVLRAMRLSQAIQDGAIRMGLGRWTTEGDVDIAGARLIEAALSTTSAMAAAR